MQTFLRDSFGWEHGDYWFPDIRTLPGAIVMFVCVLYPYVYLLARTAFLERASGMLEAARTLGIGPWRPSLPYRCRWPPGPSWPVLRSSLMETLADYGTVAYFAVNTFTTGIYRAWFSLGDRVAAAQLAAMLLAFVLFLLTVERISRGRALPQHHRPQPADGRARLKGLAAGLAILACVLPLLLGFVPAGRLAAQDGADRGDAQFGERFLTLSRNSFVLAGATAAIGVLLALLLATAPGWQERPGQRPEPPGRPGLCRAGGGDRRWRTDSGDPPR